MVDVRVIAATCCDNNSLVFRGQCFAISPTASTDGTMKDLLSVERDHIQEVLSQTNWKIEGPGSAASILDIHLSTLCFRLKNLGIKRPA